MASTSSPQVYTIAGKQFALKPLTLRQRALASPMEQKLRALIFKVAGQESSATPAEQLQTALDVSVQLDELQYSEEFPRFLATILTPQSEIKWSPSCIDQNWELMWEMDEETMTEVLRDFFSRASKSLLASPVSMSASPTPKSPSNASAPSEDSTLKSS